MPIHCTPAVVGEKVDKGLEAADNRDRPVDSILYLQVLL